MFAKDEHKILISKRTLLKSLLFIYFFLMYLLLNKSFFPPLRSHFGFKTCTVHPFIPVPSAQRFCPSSRGAGCACTLVPFPQMSPLPILGAALPCTKNTNSALKREKKCSFLPSPWQLAQINKLPFNKQKCKPSPAQDACRRGRGTLCCLGTQTRARN